MRALLLAGVASLGASLASAADFETPVTLPAGSHLLLKVERSRATDPSQTPMVMTFRYRQDIRADGDGYVVRQRMIGVDYPPDMAEAEKAQVAAMAEPMADITYTADESLTPVRVEGWQALIDRMASFGQGERDRAIGEGVRQMFGRMTPEMAARTLLREQQMTAAPQGTWLDLRKALSERTAVPNPMGGPPIDSVYSIELESVDKASGKAVIRTSSKLDPQSASRSLTQGLKAMAKRLPGAPKPTDAELAAICIERSVVCRYEMDVATGLAAVSDCTQTVSGTDQSLKPRVQIDRWVITQSIARGD